MYGYGPCGFGGGGIIAFIVVIFILLCLFGVGGNWHGGCGHRCGTCC